jgi:N-acetylmuramoyl-L-alanine amidase
MKSPGGRNLAQCVDAELAKIKLQGWTLTNRGFKSDSTLYRNGLAVLRGTYCPAILVEVAFISNPKEETFLANKHFQQKVAGAIYHGIMKYLGKE